MGQVQEHCCNSDGVAAGQNDIYDKPPAYLMSAAFQEEIKSSQNKFDYHTALSTSDDRENGESFPKLPAAAYESPPRSETYFMAPPPPLPEAPDILPPPVQQPTVPMTPEPEPRLNMNPSVSPPSVAPPKRESQQSQREPVHEEPRRVVPNPNEEIEVILEKTAQMSKLGVSVDTSEKDCLIVDKVDGGMMGAWNAANPGAMVLKGDRIVEVCGVRGDNAPMTVACRQNDVLIMKVVRR